MIYEDLSLSVDDGVARITVTRPDRLNAMRDRTADELCAVLDELEADERVRAAILTGEGRAFGAGYDLSTVDLEQIPDLDRVLEMHFNPLIRRMRQSRLPIVTAVKGPCAGASVGVALAGDIVIAGRQAYFYEPFVGIALVPDAGNSLFLTRMAGRVRAAAAMLLGDRIPAEEALSWGLVWRLYDEEELMPAAEEIARQLSRRSAFAVSRTKRLLAAAADEGLVRQLDLERRLQGEAGRGPDMKVAIAGFLKKA